MPTPTAPTAPKPLILLLLLPLALSGCLLLAAGAGVAAGGAGYAYISGKMTHTFDAPIAEVQAAALATLKHDFQYVIFETEPTHLQARTPESTTIKIDLEYKSANKTKISIRIGTFGDKDLSHAILSKIEAHLNLAKPAPYPGGGH